MRERYSTDPIAGGGIGKYTAILRRIDVNAARSGVVPYALIESSEVRQRQQPFGEQPMANECKVFEMIAPRNRAAALRPVPFLAYSALSDTGTVTFNKSTQMVTVVSSLAGTLTFEATNGTDPDGTVAPFPIVADTPYDFDVRPGSIMRFDT